MSKLFEAVAPKRARVLSGCLMSLVLFSEIATSSEADRRPINKGGSYVFPADSQFIPAKDKQYKIVFNVTKGSDDHTKLNPSLNRVARTVNLYVASGVPLENLKLVAVISSDAAPTVLADAHYQTHFGVPNPNLPLLDQLQQAGVKLNVCAQSVNGEPYQRDWVYPSVGLALSALTTVTLLQQEGYALLPL